MHTLNPILEEVRLLKRNVDIFHVTYLPGEKCHCSWIIQSMRATSIGYVEDFSAEWQWALWVLPQIICRWFACGKGTSMKTKYFAHHLLHMLDVYFFGWKEANFCHRQWLWFCDIFIKLWWWCEMIYLTNHYFITIFFYEKLSYINNLLSHTTILRFYSFVRLPQIYCFY